MRHLSSKIKELNLEKYEMANNILDETDTLKNNFSEFLELFDHISNEYY